MTELVVQIHKGIVPEPGYKEYKIGKLEKLAGYYVLEDGKAILILEVDRAEAFGDVSNFTIRSVGTAILLVVVLVAIGAVMSRAIARPIRLLTKVIDQNAEFDFTESRTSINDIANKATDMVGYANDTGEKAEDNARFAQELEEIVKKFKT